MPGFDGLTLEGRRANWGQSPAHAAAFRSELSPESLAETLSRAQGLGFLGPGPVDRHVTHALEMAAFLPAGVHRALDLGSGGGVPGLVLAGVRPELSWVLLDAGQRRCRFLREAVAELGLTGRVEVVEDRAESAARRPELREQMDAVVARSFGSPPVTAECAVGFLRLGGRLVVSEPPEATTLLGDGPTGGRWSEEGLDTLGLTAPRPGGGAEASFVWFEKHRADERWPRRVGVPAKRPLWRG